VLDDLTSEICGAKLRDGTSCLAHVAEGATRCFKHGGAPGSGAPRGNRNGLKHGAYADGGERKTPRRTRVEAGMREIAQWSLFHPAEATTTAPRDHQGGQTLAKLLEADAKDLSRRLRRRLDPTRYSEFRAQRDVLQRLLAAPSCFESEFAFRCQVACVSLVRFEARSKLRAGQIADVLSYSDAWAKFCGELIWRKWPDGEPKPN
jgi:glucans biosynthesis protein